MEYSDIIRCSISFQFIAIIDSLNAKKILRMLLFFCEINIEHDDNSIIILANGLT
jgi:hypothetical protein